MSAADAITIREYFDVKFISLEDQLNIKISALEKATVIAAGSMEKRLEGMNEFRDQLRDQTSTFVTKPEYVQQMSRVNEDIKTLSEFKSQFIGRAEHDNMLAKINDDIRMLRESKANLEGKASQSSVNTAIVIAVIGIIIGICGLLNQFAVSKSVTAYPPSMVQSAK